MVLGPGEGGEEPNGIDDGTPSSESSLQPSSTSDSTATAADIADKGVMRSSERLRLTADRTTAP